MVDHIELTDRHNADVLRTIQSRLSELSTRMDEHGSSGDREAILAVEHRLNDIIDRLGTDSQGPDGDAYQALESQISILNEHMQNAQSSDNAGPAVANLEARINSFADRLSVAEQSFPGPAEIDNLKSGLSTIRAEMSKMPKPVFPSALQVLETRLGTLAREVDTLRVSSVSPSRFNDFGARLDDVHSRLRTAEKNISGADTSSVNSRLEELQNRLRRTEKSLNNSPDIKTVETRFKEVQQRISATEKGLAKCTDTETLERRLSELTKRLEQSLSGGRVDPQVENLETRVNEIVSRLDHGETEIDGADFKGLENQINRIGLRLDQAEERFDTPLQSIQANLSQLYESLESSRSTTIQAAEQAAVAAAQKIMASRSGEATSTEAADAIATLETSLDDVKSATKEADRRTEETLEAVHDTLERVVERLTFLESTGHEADKIAASDAGSEEESHDDFRLPPLPDIPPFSVDADEPAAGIGRDNASDDSGAEAHADTLSSSVAAPLANTKDEAAAEPNFARTYDSSADDNEDSGFSRNGDFIAAARRAAQAANRAENGENGELSDKNQPSLIPIGKSKKRTLLYAVAALFLAVGALSVSGVLTPGDSSRSEAPTSTSSISDAGNGSGSGASAKLTNETPKAFSYVPDLTSLQNAPGLQLATEGEGLVVEMVTPAQVAPQFAPTSTNPDNSRPFAATTPGAGQKGLASETTLAPSRFGVPTKTTMASLQAAPQKPVAAPIAAPAQAFDLPPAKVGSEELRKAAASGNAAAQFLVGAAFANGRTGKADNATAAIWYQRAAAQGHPPAQYRLGTLYEKGRGVEKDVNSARTWYERAAQSGNRKAMHNLAVLLASTALGQPDFSRAARWFLKAAQMGLADSQFNLGILHERGLGVENDPAKAYRWFRIAAAAGDKDAQARSIKLEDGLPAGLLARTRADVAAWRPKTPDPAANTTDLAATNWTANASAPAIASPIAIAASGETKQYVSRAQRLLVELGYNPGPADGLVGPRTRQAIKTFERERGLPVTGRADLGVVRALEDAAG